MRQAPDEAGVDTDSSSDDDRFEVPLEYLERIRRDRVTRRGDQRSEEEIVVLALEHGAPGSSTAPLEETACAPSGADWAQRAAANTREALDAERQREARQRELERRWDGERQRARDVLPAAGGGREGDRGGLAVGVARAGAVQRRARAASLCQRLWDRASVLVWELPPTPWRPSYPSTVIFVSVSSAGLSPFSDTGAVAPRGVAVPTP